MSHEKFDHSRYPFITFAVASAKGQGYVIPHCDASDGFCINGQLHTEIDSNYTWKNGPRFPSCGGCRIGSHFSLAQSSVIRTETRTITVAINKYRSN